MIKSLTSYQLEVTQPSVNKLNFRQIVFSKNYFPSWIIYKKWRKQETGQFRTLALRAKKNSRQKMALPPPFPGLRKARKNGNKCKKIKFHLNYGLTFNSSSCKFFFQKNVRLKVRSIFDSSIISFTQALNDSIILIWKSLWKNVEACCC